MVHVFLLLVLVVFLSCPLEDRIIVNPIFPGLNSVGELEK
jgi:hypothetical protein